MKFFSNLVFLIGLCAQANASSICRNATNTVIYKTSDASAQLFVTQILDSKPVLKLIDLKKHDVILAERNLLALSMEEDEIVSTSSVRVRITKQDNEPFSRDFMHLSSDLSAIETLYICESREKVELSRL
jgi:hypothetical protein